MKWTNRLYNLHVNHLEKQRKKIIKDLENPDRLNKNIDLKIIEATKNEYDQIIKFMKQNKDRTFKWLWHNQEKIKLHFEFFEWLFAISLIFISLLTINALWWALNF